MHSTLLLNADYSPLKIIPWTRAVHMWFSDKVEIVETYDDFDLKSMTVTIKCPAVVRLLSYVKRSNRRVKFSRVNVFGRDQFQCQYCRCSPGTSDLTYDHVIPRAQGGKTVWDNIVTACLKCNSKKGNRTPEEADMRLLKQPVRPKERPFYQFTLNVPKTPEAWRTYLYWNQELEHDESRERTE
jgi:5-methylcytosine-specific restriction endonuclease McrA